MLRPIQAKQLAPSEVALAGKYSRLSPAYMVSDSDAPLLEIAGSLNPHGLKLGLAQRRQQQCRQDGDDRNDYQQLDQSKPCPQPRNAATGAPDPVNGHHCHPNLQAKTSL